jgi:hypothetical protein
MRRTHSAAALPASLLAIIVALALSACFPGGAPAGSDDDEGGAPSTAATETATPEPQVAPARADLALSPDGMGTLVFGQVPSTDPATQMIVLEPDWCTDDNTGFGIGVGPGDPAAALWVPIPAYRDARLSDFGVHVFADVLSRIDLDFQGPTIPTTAGIRVGDARSAVVAAYPDATLVGTGLTDIYVVTGAHGTLQIEVSTIDPYWEGFRPADVVVYVHATETGIAPFSVAGTENIAGGCSIA